MLGKIFLYGLAFVAILALLFSLVAVPVYVAFTLISLGVPKFLSWLIVVTCLYLIAK